MDAIAKMDNLSSAAAFVEGGIQDAFDDACSICLEPFCDSNPSTVTGCKHEFHLQCILEWCQRSSQCPMCLQPISLKDTDSQELLEVVERERIIRANQTRSTAIFHHPALGDFEFQHLPIDTTDSELEERIIHHLAAAAAMGRAHHNARREVQRVRAAAHGRPQLLVLSSTPNATLGASDSISSPQRIENELPAAVPVASPSAVMTPVAVASQVLGASQGLGIEISPAVGIASNSGSGPSSNRVSVGQPSPVSQDRAGPSDFHSFSESLKSRLNAVSMRYKDSISKSTRGWKERLFSRNSSMSEIGSEVRREVSAGIATVSRMMERLDTRESRRNISASVGQTPAVNVDAEPTSVTIAGNQTHPLPSDCTAPTSYTVTSGSN